MLFQVKDDLIAVLRAAPSADADVVRGLGPNTALGEGKPSADGLWIEVTVAPDRGWVLMANCVNQAPNQADDEAIAIKCVLTDWRFNVVEEVIPPWSVFADFLIVRKIFVAGNAQLPGEDGVGPMNVTTAEWDNDFLINGGDLKTGRTSAHRLDPIKQIEGAAWRMHSDAKKMHALQVTAGKATAKNPFVPSFLDIFFAYLTGSPAAALAISNAQTSNVAIDQVLSGPVGPIPAAQVQPLMNARQRFFYSAPNMPRMMPDFVKEAETFLNNAFIQAFADIKNFINEAVPEISGTAAPWLDVANTQIGVDANKPADANTIIGYFKSTDFGAGATAATPWCGAFAAHCMKKSGNDTAAASVPKESAAAASWKNWGSQIPYQQTDTVPKGAVVVLAPTSETGGSGHVGFFDHFSTDRKQVFLLGGNQSRKVGITPFPTSQIAYVGWLDLVPATEKAGPLVLPGDIAVDNRQFAQLIVDKFAAAGFGKFQQIAAVANAIAESKLDPKAHNTNNEDSVGLFQLFRIKGVGGNHSVAKLQDPVFNTDLIIAEAKRYPAFINAATLTRAVEAFVTLVERPAHPEVQISKRLQIAQKLVA